MKKTILFLSFVVIGLLTKAQTDSGKVETSTIKRKTLSILMDEFCRGIVPSAFSPKWPAVKVEWTKNLDGVKDAGTAKRAVADLAGNLKPGTFTSSAFYNKLMVQLGAVKSLADVASALKSLSDNLQPAVFYKDFSSEKKTWNEYLSAIK